MTKNADKNLNGKSVKGEHNGRDFSHADIKSTIFEEAKLVEANFQNAKAGLQYYRIIILVIIAAFFAMITGLLTGFSGALLNLVFDTYTNSALIKACLLMGVIALLFPLIDKGVAQIVIVVIVSTIFAVLWVVISSGWNLVYAAAVPVSMVMATFGIISVGWTISLGSFCMEGVKASVIIMLLAFCSILFGTVSIQMAWMISNITFFKLPWTISMVWGVCSFITAFHISQKIIAENEQFLTLRQLAISFTAKWGTDFRNADLKSANFTEACLRNTRFNSKTVLMGTRLLKVKNLELSDLRGTILAFKQVRELLVTGNGKNGNFQVFHGLNFQGAYLANTNLENANFTDADLTNADLQDANLINANLTRVQALGTNFSGAILTGACLEGWNIDTETRLDDIDCRYYYYLENGAKKRMPPEGEEYSAGEFTRIFQKIANTIDFIAHNEMELAAIKLSVEQVRVESGNDDIRVQAIEEKDGFIVVKVTVPKTEDRGVLYHEVNVLKQEYETKIQALTKENYIQIGKIETLREELEKQRRDLLAAIKPNILIENSTLNNNGITNLGEINGNVSSQ